MSEPRDPHEIHLSDLFPSLPPERRAEMRDLLDRYCEAAYAVFERLEREQALGIDPSQKSS